MSVTQADLDRLDSMIASGVLVTMYDGKRIEYRSMSELIAARAATARRLALASGSQNAPYSNPSFDKGV